jgi:uncharacterized small protein (TIGR04563 family)
VAYGDHENRIDESKRRRMTDVSDKESVSKIAIDGAKTDKRKQSLYFPESMLQEIKEEAARLDRSLSWIVQRAWKLARVEIKKLPSVNDVDGGDEDDDGLASSSCARSGPAVPSWLFREKIEHGDEIEDFGVPRRRG